MHGGTGGRCSERVGAGAADESKVLLMGQRLLVALILPRAPEEVGLLPPRGGTPQVSDGTGRRYYCGNGLVLAAEGTLVSSQPLA